MRVPAADTPRDSRPSRVDIALAALALLSVLAPIFPPVGLTPNRDSGVFLYVAAALLDGHAPYADAWDHKPPLIYLLDSPAVALGSPAWGTWVLVGVWLALAVWILSSLLGSAFGWPAARWGLAACLVLLSLTFKGNLPEEFALLLQASALALVGRIAVGEVRRTGLISACIGALGGLALLLKPTLIGLWLAVAISWVLGASHPDTRRRALTQLLAAGAGGLAVIALAVAVLALAGVLPDFWSSVVVYNLVYAGGGDRWTRLLQGVGEVGPMGWLALLCGGVLYLLGLRAVWRRTTQNPGASALRTLGLVAMIDLPLEALMTLGSGRLYLQYLTPWSVSLAVLVALVASTIVPARFRLRWQRWSGAALACALALVVFVVAVKIEARRPEAEQVRLAVAAIRASTGLDEPVLVWGAETQVLVLADRSAPSRYAYLYPLLTEGYATEARTNEFLDDLRSNPPALIIDTSATNAVIPPLDPAERATWESPDPQYQPPASMEAVFTWVEANYSRSGQVGPWGVLTHAQP